MKSIACSFSYGQTEISYELLRMQRKSLVIAVHPDKRVVVKAPVSLDLSSIKDKVEQKARWISRKIDYFKNFEPRTPPRRYVAGESHLYLGRKYRLKIEPSENNSLRLKAGYFLLPETSPDNIKALLEDWYRQRADEVFVERFNAVWLDFNQPELELPRLRIRSMKTRWGSCSTRGWISLNLQLIKTSKECIDYVLMHEFCHLIHHNHGAGFYALLDKKMPDWKQRKIKLDQCFL